MTTETAPVFVFRDRYNPDDWWPEDYVDTADTTLQDLGWLARPLTDPDEQAAAKVLHALRDLSLDETDVYPFGLLWALRATGAIGHVDGLDSQLRDWREWEETDHVGEPLDFLPSLPGTEEPA